MRRRYGWLERPQQRLTPWLLRRVQVVTAVVAALVLAGAGAGIAAGPHHHRAAKHATAAGSSSSFVPVTSFVPAGMSFAVAPTVPATVGTPLGLLEAPTSAAKPALTLQPEAFNAMTLQAYQHAVAVVAAADPGCGITWQVLAGIGRIESDNGRDVPAGGGMTANGTITPPILGPALDGTHGFAAIHDGRGWAHATGPFQFIPSTWQSWGADGNGDGVNDPDNIFDASLAAAHYLCSGERTLTKPTQLADAIYSYNHSASYVDLVLKLIAGYSHESPTALLAAAQLQRLPGGGAVTAPSPTPAATPASSPSAAATWRAPALSAEVAPGAAVTLQPLAHAPAADRGAAVTVASEPRLGSVDVLGSSLVFHAAHAGGSESFRYAVAGHGAATATVRVVAGTAAPAPAVGAPTASFDVTVTPDGTSLDLSGDDSGSHASLSALTLTSSWTFALTPDAAEDTPALVLPPASGSADPSASQSPAATTSPSAATSRAAGGGQTWKVTQSWTDGGEVDVVIEATSSCRPWQSCSAPAAPATVGVTGGTFAGATHDLTVSAGSASSAVATATTALPLSTDDTRLQAKTD